MATKGKRRRYPIGYDGAPEGVAIGPNVVEELLGRDRDGTWFVAARRQEVAPGVSETLLEAGWYPGMRIGQEILFTEEDDEGRRAYVVRTFKTIEYRCMRRIIKGWCQNRSFGPCTYHRYWSEDTYTNQDHHCFLYPGEAEMPPGFELVGYISAGAATYFVRTPSGVIRPMCLRRRSQYGLEMSAQQGGSVYPRCMRHPALSKGKRRGACRQHRWTSRRERLMNAIDPYFQNLVTRVVTNDPALDQIRARIDTITHAWFIFLEGVTKRQRLLEDTENDYPRDTGLEAVLSAARNIAEATAVQSRLHADVFRPTATVWAQQAYAMRLARVLVEEAIKQGPAVGRRVASNMQGAMEHRGLVTDRSHLPELPEPVSAGASIPGGMEVTPSGFKVRNMQELEVLEALRHSGRNANYELLAEAIGDKLYSLYPLIRVLDDMLALEEAEGAPLKVRNAIFRARTSAMQKQAAIDNQLRVKLSVSQWKVIHSITEGAVMDAIVEETPAVQSAILRGFLDRRGEIEMPERADSAVDIVLQAVAQQEKKGRTG